MVKTLLVVATGWGSRNGGINSFNYDFIRGFSAAFINIKVVCVVSEMTKDEHLNAKQFGIDLRSLPYKSNEEIVDPALASEIAEKTVPDIQGHIVVLGHDIFTGEVAIELAKIMKASSAVIHHMSYETYKGYESGSSIKAREKANRQKKIFEAANIRFAIGPALRDELNEWGGQDYCTMLIPGLPEIEPAAPPQKWTTILFGRLDPSTNRIKQTKLGIVSAARCERDGRADTTLAMKLRDGTRIKVFGTDSTSEASLRQFVEDQIGAVMELHILPYTENRAELFDELRRSSVALMPSWHEGFGLVGWEAIAAGVPIVLGKDSGVYRFLNEFYPGTGTGCVNVIDIRGSQIDPHYQEDDANEMVRLIKQLAADETTGKKKALNLRKLLSEYTPKRCAEDFAAGVGWNQEVTAEILSLPSEIPKPQTPPADSIIYFPSPTWDIAKGQSYSQLLRAEEACVPYQSGDSNELNHLMNWLEDDQFPVMLAVYKGEGGTGKTRLLIECCRKAKDKGIHSGFLKSNLKAAEIKEQFLSKMDTHQRWLIVVDYAETRREQVARIIEIAQTRADIHIKIVLLAREAGEWWERFPTDFPTCENLITGPATASPRLIQPLHADSTTRSYAYVAAIKSYALRLEIKDTEKLIATLPNLDADYFSKPLFLQMAALLALHGERADSPNGLVDGILRHESRYWNALADSQQVSGGSRLIGHLMGIATLAGGLATERDAWNCLEKTTFLLPSKTEFSRIYRALFPLYPGKQGLHPLQPDLLGEALVAKNLSGTQEEWDLESLISGTSSQCENALTVLARCLRNRPAIANILQEILERNFAKIWRSVIKVGIETGGTFINVACDAFGNLRPNEQLQIATPLLSEIEASSLKWDKLVLLATEAIVAHLKTKLDRAVGVKREEARRSYARALVNRSVARNYLGDHEGAQSDAKASIVEFQRCEKMNDGLIAEYANSLNNASNRAAALLNYSAALEYSAEAVKLFAELRSRAKGDMYLRDYASALTNYGATFASVFDYEKAIEINEEVLRLLRPVIETGGEKFVDPYGTVLRNLPGYYREVDKPEKSLETALSAVLLYKPLAENEADRYAGAYASALNAAATAYRNVDDLHSAIEAGSTAARILYEVARARLEKYGEYYGIVQTNLSVFYDLTCDREKALACAREAVQIFWKLSDKSPAIYLGDYSNALFRLAMSEAALGNYSKTCETYSLAEVASRNAYRLHPKQNADDIISILLWNGFFHWLETGNGQLNSIHREVSELMSEVPQIFIAECNAELLFVKACMATAYSRFEAFGHFEEFLISFNALLNTRKSRLGRLAAISLHFIATMQPSLERRGQAESAWSFVKKYSVSKPHPQWISDTIRRLGLPPLSWLEEKRFPQ